MPEETKPASGAQQPRPLHRTLLIAGLSCLSAMLIAAGFLWVQRARRGDLETNAVGSCRAYCEAQTMYHRNDFDGDGKLAYAHPYTEVLKQADMGSPICLIDGAFASDAVLPSPESVPRSGYLFQDMQTLGGKPIDWISDFALCATPARYGKTGYRTFIIKTDGTTWGRDLGRSQFVSDFPADPAAAGWRIAE